MATAADNPYLRDAVMTATPEQLQLMLYDGAIRYTAQARDALTAKEFECAYERLARAQAIIVEMQTGLNYDVNRELCERMGATYGFLYRKLIDANVQHDVVAIDDALKVMRIERKTWQILVDKVNKVRQGAETVHQADETAASFAAEG